MCIRTDYFIAEAENRALTGRANTADSIFASECEECGSSACVCYPDRIFCQCGRTVQSLTGWEAQNLFTDETEGVTGHFIDRLCQFKMWA